MKEKIKHMIYEIKTFVYHTVGGQLKTKQQQSADYIENPFYQLRYTDGGWPKLKFKQIMTYIIAGKLNNNPFLMVDCVGTTANGEHQFMNKLNKLKSTKDETFSVITGYDAFQYAINFFDTKCYENDIIFDIENESQINEILELYEFLKNNEKYTKGYDIEKDFYHTGLFFISKNNIVWYLINKDEGKMVIRKKSRILNNQILDDIATTFNTDDFNFKNIDEIINYCKTTIIKHYKRKEETKNLDLKDKFSFIMFNENEKIKIFPYENNEELIDSIIGCDYSKINKLEK
jgi:hypothetical protein